MVCKVKRVDRREGGERILLAAGIVQAGIKLQACKAVQVKNFKMTRKVIPPHRVVTQEEVVGFGSSIVEAEG